MGAIVFLRFLSHLVLFTTILPPAGHMFANVVSNYSRKVVQTLPLSMKNAIIQKADYKMHPTLLFVFNTCDVIGVVPVSSVSSVVGQADVTALLTNGVLRDLLSSSAPSQLRLAWKRPAQALAAIFVSNIRTL